MGLEIRNGHYYYTRSQRVNGRVKRRYVGSGLVARVAAQDAEIKRLVALEVRRRQHAQWQQERNAADALDHAVDAVCEDAAAAFHAVMATAGYHQHARGDWRKKRREKQHGR